MKTTIRKTFLMLLPVLALTGCTKDEDTNPGRDLSDELLLIEEKQADFVYKYEYDERNRMVLWDMVVGDGGATVHFAYDENDRLIGLDRRNGQGTITSKETYSYGNGGRPVSGTFTAISNGEEYTLQIQLTYTQNTVTETHIAPDGTIGNIITYTYDSNGNLVSEQNESANESLNYLFEFGSYDDKPYSHAKWPFAWKEKWVNNYQSYRSITVNGIQNHIYEYTYNDADYPVKAEIYDRQTEELITTREYTYKKAN